MSDPMCAWCSGQVSCSIGLDAYSAHQEFIAKESAAHGLPTPKPCRNSAPLCFRDPKQKDVSDDPG